MTESDLLATRRPRQRALTVAVALLAGFVGLWVVSEAWPVPDDAGHAWVLDHVDAEDRQAWRAASWPGASLVGLAVGLVGAGLCALAGQRRVALIGAGSTVVLVASVQALKRLIGRTRPAGADEATFAFPSGHAATALFAYGLVALVILPALATRWPRIHGFRPLALGIWIGLALGVGAARILGGVHWPTDVLAGWCWAGAFLAGACWLAFRPTSSSPQRI